jgi:SNF family Na+-dependent transporter
MGWKRRVFLVWLVASAAWIAFAFFHVIGPQLGEIDWSFLDIVDCVAVLFGLPVAALGTGIAVLWIERAGREPDHPERR